MTALGAVTAGPATGFFLTANIRLEGDDESSFL
jgi:hypothetical protein